ncbi:MAG: DMT family transporter [Verrucomicrobiales bacterium]|nr:DMT family transporter [Verrucomicrobiales bacterium]
MFAAFLTTILFSVSGVTATRTTRLLPSLEANFWRLFIATCLLAIYGHTLGAGIGGAAFPWLLVSGFIGFGIGDIALYLAYPKLGSRLVILIVHCVAAPLAAAIEWSVLGVPMSSAEMLAGGLILTGVATALFPDRRANTPGRPGFGVGVGFALVAATGQGVGAILSRQAFGVAQRAGESLDGISAAYQRILAGLALSAVTYLWVKRRAIVSALSGVAQTEGESEVAKLRRALPWVALNALAGPALGVSCFQWALAERGTGVVLPIVALTPLMIIPFAIKFEGERPCWRSLAGGAVAVAGAIIHALNH